MRRHWPLLVLLALIMLLILFVDRQAALLLRATVPDGAKPVLNALTTLGESHWYLWPTGVLALAILMVHYRTEDSPRRRNVNWVGGIAFYLFAAVALSGIVTDIIKPIVGRARPKLLHGEQQFYGFNPLSWGADNWSFPSGHATTVFALALAVAFLLPRWRLALVMLALVLALTRPLLGAHYPSDIIAGGIIGAGTAVLLRIWLAGRGWVFRHAENPAAPGAIEPVPPPWKAGGP